MSEAPIITVHVSCQCGKMYPRRGQCPDYTKDDFLYHAGPRPNLRIGAASHAVDRRMGFCLRCQTTWDFVEHHTTEFANNQGGCFPLCDPCWEELTPVGRLPYYRNLFDQWEMQGGSNVEWGVIEAAVLSEDDPMWPSEIC